MGDISNSCITSDVREFEQIYTELGFEEFEAVEKVTQHIAVLYFSKRMINDIVVQLTMKR